MKYIKLYEDFSEVNIENIDDYDWQYLFQEIIDDFDIEILVLYIDDNLFKDYEDDYILLELDIPINIFENFFYFQYDSSKSKMMSPNFEKFRALEKSFIDLIDKVKLFGGEISINRNLNGVYVLITKNTFKNLKI